jgi:hypothetical protein
VINRWLIILCELGKVFHCYRINIDCEILAQGELNLKRVLNLIKIINDYSVDINIFHIIMSKSKHLWWMYNDYIKKLITKRLSQTTYDFANI